MGIFENWPYTNFHEKNLDWIISRVKEDSKLILKNIQDIDNLESIINETSIETYLYDIIQELIDDGTLSSIVSQAAGAVVTPEMFGATGDGVNDDSQAFDDAFDTGKIVYLSNKTYNVRAGLSNDLPPVLIGDNATILIGDNTWKYNTSVYIQGITFKSDLISAKDYISFDSVMVDEFICKNCKFIDLLATDAARPRACALRARANRVDISQIYVNGVAKGIVFNNSSDVVAQEYIHINNILGVNMETLVDIEGSFGSDLHGYVNNVNISDIVLINTSNIKNNISGAVGKDAVLVGGVHQCQISNVISIFAKERAVYLNNCKNGSVNNIIAVHSEGVKVAGTSLSGYVTFYTENVQVDNVRVEDGYQAFAIKTYDVKNCTFSNISIDGGSYADPDNFRAIEISRTAIGLVFDGIHVSNIGRGIIGFEDDSLTVTNIQDITIKNVDGFDFCKTTGYDAVNFYNTVPIYNIKLINFDLNPNAAVYDTSKNFNHFASPVNVDGLYISNIKANGFSTVEEPIKIDATCSNVKIVDTRLFYAGASDADALSLLSDDSDYICFTASNTATYRYSIEVQRAPLKSNKDIYVKMPCPRNIFGDISKNKDIILQGPAQGSIKVRSGSGTPTTGFGYNAYGVVTATESGIYHVLVIEQI